MFTVDKVSLITIDSTYMKSLYDSCKEVFYQSSNYDNKPYLGILIHQNGREYAIPLTSPKEKHKNLKLFGNGLVVVHETIKDENISKGMIVTDNHDGTSKHILSVLCLYKMIPVKNGVYSIVNVNRSANDDSKTTKYKDLLNKELSFCVSNKEKILKEASKIYNRQIESGKVFFKHCDFKALELVCDRY